MPYLLDTHSFLWFVSASNSLSTKARTLIESSSNNYLSIASIWEISIKASLGKLTINGNFDSVLTDITDNYISILPITFNDTNTLFSLPFHHRDPFDRMIISQAINSGMDIGKDPVFDIYLATQAIKRVW